MNLYNAGLVAANLDKHSNYYHQMTDAERRWRDSNPWQLESYHYVKKDAQLKKMRKDKMKVFLDSGAYSAFSLGSTIDIGAYCDYCHENSDVVAMASVLDAIGDYKGTYRNQIEMERRGVQALPCYHYGEPYEVGLHYAENYEYITLGGLVPISTPQMIIWLDEVFEKILCRPDGSLKCKVHGFGVTSPSVMLRYPWTSVDSSSWVQFGAFGNIFLPNFGQSVTVSSRSPSAKTWGKHFTTFTKPQQDAILAEIEANGGDMDRLANLQFPRWAWNAWALPEWLNRTLEGKPAKFNRPQPGLF